MVLSYILSRNEPFSSPCYMSEFEEQTIHTCLTQCKNIALVGASPKPELAANEVMQYLLQHNIKVLSYNIF